MFKSCCIVTDKPGHAIHNDIKINGGVIDRCSVLTYQPGQQSSADPVNYCNTSNAKQCHYHMENIFVQNLKIISIQP